MFVILWEYEVKPGCEEWFESVYGPQGEWVRLFQLDPLFLETRLLQDLSRPRFYFTLDYWDSETAFLQFKAAHQAEYETLDQSTGGKTTSERRLASFNIESM